MDTPKNFFFVLGEWWESRRTRAASHEPFSSGRKTSWLPTPGSVLFTLLMIGLLLWAQSAGAIPLPAAPASISSSTNTIAYQGRLADANGTPLTGTYSIIFRLYSAASGGVPLWEEQWTGSNGVSVSDGLFNVMLGSLTPIPQAVVTGNNALWLGITVGTDNEMAPRVQLGSVPFAMLAQKVATGAIAPMQSGLVPIPSDRNSPNSNVWTDVPDWYTTITLQGPSTVFVSGSAFVGRPTGSICEIRVVIADSNGIAARYQSDWETVPLHHTVHLPPGTYTIKVQAIRVSGSGTGIVASMSAFSYFVQPDPSG